ncbi:MAG: hypothetical protein H6753_04245 [Candidatus Omnitrophica bacterium]|nr:hypothetical protein [Candidatus Omnitrophota bacterium]
MNRFALRDLRWIFMVILIVTVGVGSGCEPLRKKFVRKKKTDAAENQTTVILDPIDYPDIVKTAAQIYQQHYDLWKVWQSELETIVADNANEKKVQYVLGQIKEQLNGMRDFLQKPAQEKIDLYIQDIQQLNLEFEKSNGFRNQTMILSKIRALRRNIKDQFAPNKIANSL